MKTEYALKNIKTGEEYQTNAKSFIEAVEASESIKGPLDIIKTTTEIIHFHDKPRGE